MRTIKSDQGVVIEYPETVKGHKVSASIWERASNGRVITRIYFKILFAGQKPVECGYVDGETGETGGIKSQPVSWAQNLASELSIKVLTLEERQAAHDKAHSFWFGNK